MNSPSISSGYLRGIGKGSSIEGATVLVNEEVYGMSRPTLQSSVDPTTGVTTTKWVDTSIFSTGVSGGIGAVGQTTNGARVPTFPVGVYVQVFGLLNGNYGYQIREDSNRAQFWSVTLDVIRLKSMTCSAAGTAC